MDDKAEYYYANNFIKESYLVLEIGCGRALFPRKYPLKNTWVLNLVEKQKKLLFAMEL